MPWQPPGPVLVPVDFNDESPRAVARAFELTEPDNVVLVHVLSALSLADPGVLWRSVSRLERHEHARQAVLAHFVPAGQAPPRVEIREGDVARQIAAVADELRAGLIVIPSQGRAGLSRWLLGSVAERVTRLARCPVLVRRA